MITRTKLEIALALLLLGSSALGFSSWLEAHDARIRMQDTIAAQEKSIATQKQQQDALAEQARQRDAALQSQIAAMQQTVARIRTPSQIAQWLPKQVQTPQPVTIDVPPGTNENPTPDATAQIPQADLPALRDYAESCGECRTKLATAQQDAASRSRQLQLAGEQLSAMQNERDAAVKAAKGGGFWRRLKSNAKWFAIGGGAAASALCGAGHCK